MPSPPALTSSSHPTPVQQRACTLLPVATSTDGSSSLCSVGMWSRCLRASWSRIWPPSGRGIVIDRIRSTTQTGLGVILRICWIQLERPGCRKELVIYYFAIDTALRMAARCHGIFAWKGEVMNSILQSICGMPMCSVALSGLICKICKRVQYFSIGSSIC